MTPGPGEDVTIGEISRGLVALEGRINDKFAQINHRLDTMEFVPRGEHNLQIRELTDRLAALEDDKKWTRRTLVAAFLYPVLVAAVVAMVVLK
jgi:type II secretory pathway component PulF